MEFHLKRPLVGDTKVVRKYCIFPLRVSRFTVLWLHPIDILYEYNNSRWRKQYTHDAHGHLVCKYFSEKDGEINYFPAIDVHPSVNKKDVKPEWRK